MPATAADVPQELFERILHFLNINAYVNEEYQRQIASINKHDLGMAVLVCRYWARLCQTKMFEEVALKSREDVAQLLDLLKATDGCIASSIQHLDIQTLTDDGAVKPYVHLLPSLYPCIPSPLTISIRMEGPIRRSRGSFRSIHRALPRTCPAFSVGIEHLHLSDIHVLSFSELMHVVGELPELSRLICTRLTWDSPPMTLPVKRLAAGRSFHEILISHCSENWAAVTFFTGYKRRGAMCLPAGEIAVVGRLASSIEAGIDSERFANSEATVNGTVTEDTISTTVEYNLMFTGEDDFPASATALTPTLHVSCCRSALPPLAEISIIAIDFTRPGPCLDIPPACDWAAFDTEASSLQNLKKVVFGFTTKVQMLSFVQSNAMVGLSTKGLLKYAVRDKRDIFWNRLTTEMEVVEDSKIDSIYDVW